MKRFIFLQCIYSTCKALWNKRKLYIKILKSDSKTETEAEWIYIKV